jgi:uncharacterized membrane protein YbaN (DUF454 family)
MSMQTQGKSRAKIILRQVTGYACLAGGIAGCMLPILPGIPFLFVGLGLLAVDSPWAARLRDRLKDYVAKRVSRRHSGNEPTSRTGKAPSQDSAC